MLTAFTLLHANFMGGKGDRKRETNYKLQFESDVQMNFHKPVIIA